MVLVMIKRLNCLVVHLISNYTDELYKHPEIHGLVVKTKTFTSVYKPPSDEY